MPLLHGRYTLFLPGLALLLASCTPGTGSYTWLKTQIAQVYAWQTAPPQPPTAKPTARTNPVQLARAQPDECFAGVGQPSPALPCLNTTARTNQAYVWGMARVGENLWFGTVANMLCQGFERVRQAMGRQLTYQTPSAVCELEASLHPLRDFRPPQIFVYSTAQARLLEVSYQLPAQAQKALENTVGLRSGGALNGVAFLGGPARSGQGIYLYAFDGETGQFLGHTLLLAYHDIRKWLAAQGALYTGVARSFGGGAVLRWRGSRQDPFQFEEVGQLGSMPANLALHEGRLFATTWPDLWVGQLGAGRQGLANLGGEYASLYMSPPLPTQGLGFAQANDWQVVWTARDYEPDSLIALTYLGGDLASFDGYLYWGTMHVPGAGLGAFQQVYGPPSTAENLQTAILGTLRATAVFRGRSFDQEPQLELLYGQRELPSYLLNQWVMLPTRMGAPLYGASGLGNPYNAYTWSMAVYQNQLYLGTFDMSYLVYDAFPTMAQQLGIPTDQLALLQPNGFGADLFRFANSQTPAVAIDLNGLGNPSSYGIRTLLADDSQGLYLGMANPMNLLEEGGWALLRWR